MPEPQRPLSLRADALQVQDAPLNPLCPHQHRVDLNAVRTLTPAPTGTATKLMMQAHTQNVRYTLDGTNPSVTGTNIGFILVADDPPIIVGLSANTIVKVLETTQSAELQYQWGE